MVCPECGAKSPNDAKFCFNCATPLVADPRQEAAPQTRLFEPQPAAPQTPPNPAQPGAAPQAPYTLQPARWKRRGLLKTCLGVSGMLFALLLGCGIMGAIFEGGDGHSEVERHSAALALEDEPEEADAPDGDEARAAVEGAPDGEGDERIREQQAAFIQTVESFYEPYEEAENELQASTQRAERRKELAALFPDRAVQGWTGTLESLDTNAEGHAFITIRPDGTDSIMIATWNDSSSDGGTNRMIRNGSELYNKLAEMSVGDRVVFSGTFVASDQDHLAEGSSTEAQSMTKPSFIMVISDVEVTSED